VGAVAVRRIDQYLARERDRLTGCPVKSGPYGYLYGIWGTSPNDVYVVVGGGDAIFHYDGIA
jgi:hypothetical protein